MIGVDVRSGRDHSMICEACGASAPFDEGLPFVDQTAAFDLDHGCPQAGARSSE